jgi:hypothetical protein
VLETFFREKVSDERPAQNESDNSMTSPFRVLETFFREKVSDVTSQKRKEEKTPCLNARGWVFAIRQYNKL